LTQPVRFLLDTNILSETRRKQADEKVLAFITEAAPSTLYLSVLTLGD
jgi:predicted nucleic acid-binding protein